MGEALCKLHQKSEETGSKMETTICFPVSTTEGRNKHLYDSGLSIFPPGRKSTASTMKPEFQSFPHRIYFQFQPYSSYCLPFILGSSPYTSWPWSSLKPNFSAALLSSLFHIIYFALFLLLLTPQNSLLLLFLFFPLLLWGCFLRPRIFLSSFWYPSTWQTKIRVLTILHQLRKAHFYE